MGKAFSGSAKKNAPNSAAGAFSEATSTAINGGKVLQGARQGVAGNAGNAVGSTAGAIVHEILK